MNNSLSLSLSLHVDVDDADVSTRFCRKKTKKKKDSH